MFREALLESSPMLRKRSHWPLATAFTLQLIVGSTLVLMPLISTGVVSLTSHPPTIVAPQYILPETFVPPRVRSGGGGGPVFQSPQVVSFNNTNSRIIDWRLKPAANDDTHPPQPWQPQGGNNLPPDLFRSGEITSVPAKPVTRIISRSMEALLINKVVPVYPPIARIAGVQGDVKLHAIIATDGTIQSLTVTSGPPMLIKAARDAVQQWRYRPYTLNGQPVEVETVITVSFKRN